MTTKLRNDGVNGFSDRAMRRLGVRPVNPMTNLRGFIGKRQISALAEAVVGEEGDYFVDMLSKLGERIANMPKTYEQDGKGEQAIVNLHYFSGSADFWITEKDSNPDGAGQAQAFGLADLGDGGELGYISISELIANHVELDLYWTPRTLAECRKR